MSLDSDQQPVTDTLVFLDVGGELFKTWKSTLIKSSYFNSMLNGNLYEEAMTSHKREGAVFIDRDPVLFRHILAYLRDPQYILPDHVSGELSYYGIDPPWKTVDLYTKSIDEDDSVMAFPSINPNLRSYAQNRAGGAFMALVATGNINIDKDLVGPSSTMRQSSRPMWSGESTSRDNFSLDPGVRIVPKQSHFTIPYNRLDCIESITLMFPYGNNQDVENLPTPSKYRFSNWKHIDLEMNGDMISRMSSTTVALLDVLTYTLDQRKFRDSLECQTREIQLHVPMFFDPNRYGTKCLPLSSYGQSSDVLKRFALLGVDVRIVIHWNDEHIPRHSLELHGMYLNTTERSFNFEPVHPSTWMDIWNSRTFVFDAGQVTCIFDISSLNHLVTDFIFAVRNRSTLEFVPIRSYQLLINDQLLIDQDIKDLQHQQLKHGNILSENVYMYNLRTGSINASRLDSIVFEITLSEPQLQPCDVYISILSHNKGIYRHGNLAFEYL